MTEPIDVSSLPEEEQVKLIMRMTGKDEVTVREMLAIERGESEGDVVETEEDG